MARPSTSMRALGLTPNCLPSIARTAATQRRNRCSACTNAAMRATPSGAEAVCVTTRPPFGDRANAATARSISPVSRTLTLIGLISKPSDCAAFWMAPNVAPAAGLPGFRMTATRVTFGAISLRISAAISASAHRQGHLRGSSISSTRRSMLASLIPK